MIGEAQARLIDLRGTDRPNIGDLGIISAHVLVLAIKRAKLLAVAITDRWIVAFRFRNGEAMVGKGGVIQAAKVLRERSQVRHVGEVVVVEGADKLKEGSKVTVAGTHQHKNHPSAAAGDTN